MKLDRMVNISALARLIFIDGIRRKTLVGLVFFSFSLQLSSLFFYQFIPREISRFCVDFTLSIGWISGLFFLLSHAVNVVAWDGNNQKSIQALLARPISRVDYVFGLFSGLAFLLFLLMVILCGSGSLNIEYIKTLAPDYFHNLDLRFYPMAYLGIFLIHLAILSVIIFWSSVIKGSFQVFLLSICFFLICNGLPVVRASLLADNDKSEILLLVTTWLTLIFPDFSRFDYRSFVLQAGDIGFTSVGFSISYILLYVVICTWCAGKIYNIRDLA